MKMLLGTIAALGLALPAVAVAAEPQSVTVKYADLNLSTPEGQQALDRRIESAARKVCGFGEARTGTRLDTNARACIAETKAKLENRIATLVEEQRLGG